MTRLVLRISLYFLTVILAFSCGSSKNQVDEKYPEPIGFVNDFEQVLTQAEEDELNQLLNRFEQKTTIQIAIVTIDTIMTSADSFDSYTLQLANDWGVGKEEFNNGILIGVSSSLRRIRIQNGIGIEPILSNEETRELVDNYFIPGLRDSGVYAGLKNGVVELMKRLEHR